MTRLCNRAFRWSLGMCATLALLMAIALPRGATACACGEFQGPVVAHGKSLYGVPWRIKATLFSRTRTQPRWVYISFSMPSVFGVGWGTGLDLPIHRAFVLSAITGTEITPYPEGDLSGVAAHDVATLQVGMSDGSSLTIQPEFAPSHIRDRFPWLRGLRFFDAFFPAGPRPEVVTALNAAGSVIAHGRTNRGHFPLLRGTG